MIRNMKTVGVYALVFVILVIGVGGFIYLYVTNKERQQSADTIIQSLAPEARRQAALQAEIDQLRSRSLAEAAKLAQMMTQYRAQGELNHTISIQFDAISEALRSTDDLFSGAGSKNPKLNLPATSATVISTINKLRQELNSALTSWQNTLAAIHNSTTPNTTLISQANHDIEVMNNYLNELKNVVGGLTTDSGLTQNQIDDYKKAVDDAKNTVNNATNTLNDAENKAGVTTTGGQVVVPPVTQTDINNQQNVVDQIHVDVVNLENELKNPSTGGSDQNGTGNSNGTSGSNNTGGTTGGYVPPPPPDMSGKPKLIEGTNEF